MTATIPERTPPTFIQVTADHIKRGVVADCEQCPVALALTAALDAAGYTRHLVAVEQEETGVWIPGQKWKATTPAVTAAFIEDFDSREGTAAPFCFTLAWRIEEDPDSDIFTEDERAAS